MREQLETIAEKLAKRLGRSPLAAKTVGSRLTRKKDKAAWEDALKMDNLSDPSRALLWSYEKLDLSLQRCFLYCSLYPKGYWYRIKELVHMWVAEGLIESCNVNKRMEDIGRDCFNELLSVSFFQPAYESTADISAHYVMHDLVHDLAELLSEKVCFRLEDDKVAKIPHTVRHLSVYVTTLKQHQHSICGLQNLRSFVCIEPLLDDARDIFQQVLQNLKKLRVLYLSFHNSSKLPESVGELKHLQYLNLKRTSISELPESLCALYHLQSLQCVNIKLLPEKLFSLSKLRYLEGCAQIPYIGNLTSLQHLEQFCVRKQMGYEVRQLKYMNNLGGSLCVKNLENVTGKDQAFEAKLHQKSHLQRLHLEWSYNDDMASHDSSHLETLEGLIQPPQIMGLILSKVTDVQNTQAGYLRILISRISRHLPLLIAVP